MSVEITYRQLLVITNTIHGADCICLPYSKQLNCNPKMKCTIPEISWHNKEPVLSVDIQQVKNVDLKFYRLASAGSDNHVLIWQLKIQDNGAAAIELLSDLTRHQRSVNVVRWSPRGQYLASADDDANIIIWTLKVDNIPSLDGEDENKESWIVHKILRGHKEDIYDMCWSPDGLKLLTGSIDNTAIVWDVSKGKNEHIISDHKSFVQGVAWNPMHQPPYLATLSSDRTCRILDTTTSRYQIRYRITRGTLPLPTTHPLYQTNGNAETPSGESVMTGVKLFHDDTFKTYFRRLTFSPDGNLLLVPSGYVEMNTSDVDGKMVQERKVLYGTYVFPTMGSFSSPSAVLVSPRQCTIAVRCCPLLFELRPNGPDPYVQLPYRMVFAVATDSDVVLYDTQQTAPFAHLQNIHYTRLTDLTWSSDGRILTAASTDGFCTIVTFEPNELGKVYIKEENEAEECIFNISGELPESTMEVEQENNINIQSPSPAEKDAKKRKPSFLDQWTKISKKSPKTDNSISDISFSAKKKFVGEKQSTFVSLKVANESVVRARTILFVTEIGDIEDNTLKDKKEENLDCEFIDLTNSLSNDENNRKRIIPISLTKIRKDALFDKDVTGTMVASNTSMPSTANENKKTYNMSKRRITPTLLSKEDNISKDTELRSVNDVQHKSIDTDIINLTTNELNVSIENKSKRSLSPSVVIKSKSPCSAKKLKTNTLLNFIQRKPKNMKSSSSNTNAFESVKTTYNFGSIVPAELFSDEPIIVHENVNSEKFAAILLEESARDAWKCEQKPTIVLDLTEDIPEDFKLQIEESTNTNIEQPKMAEENEQRANDDGEDGILLINGTVVETSKREPIVRDSNTKPIKTTCANANVLDVSEKTLTTNNSGNNLDNMNQGNSDGVIIEDKTLNNDRTEWVAPVKRRVPLITLSSPKNKKKPLGESLEL